MKAWDGGGGTGWGRADVETVLDTNISIHFLPVVLFSQGSRMFLFLIMTRPDAKFSRQHAGEVRRQAADSC